MKRGPGHVQCVWDRGRMYGDPKRFGLYLLLRELRGHRDFVIPVLVETMRCFRVLLRSGLSVAKIELELRTRRVWLEFCDKRHGIARLYAGCIRRQTHGGRFDLRRWTYRF